MNALKGRRIDLRVEPRGSGLSVNPSTHALLNELARIAAMVSVRARNGPGADCPGAYPARPAGRR